MPSFDHVPCSPSNHLSVDKPDLPRPAIPEKLPCFRRGLFLGKVTSRLRDRYVPQRSYSGNTTSKFHIRKLPAELFAHEKLLRRRDISGNNICRRRQRAAVLDAQFDIEETSQAPHMSPHLLDSEVNPRQYSTSVQRVTPRQVSVGAVWNVGGVSTPTRGPWLGIASGQTGYSGGKMTGPMYFARYDSDREIISSEETEMFRTRLAASMNIDLAHRQLAIPKSDALNRNHIYPPSPHYDKSPPDLWNDCALKRDVSFVSGKQARQIKGMQMC